MTDTKEGGKKALTRRVFIGRSVGAAGGAMMLSSMSSVPSWAAETTEGVFTKAGRLAYDKETGTTFLSMLKIDLKVEEISTEWGPTKVTSAKDSVVVRKKTGGGYGPEVDVSAGDPGLKMDPRLDARAGECWVTWCSAHETTRQWSVFAARADNENSRAMKVTSDLSDCLHPDVAIDGKGRPWIAYEDWSDNSIRLTMHDGSGWADPITLSKAGENYRPRVIVTDESGRNGGAVAVVWDSYRDGVYNIYMRLVRKDGTMGPELQATTSALWDSCADIAEDRDGNLWLAWVRASNELSQTSAMRTINTRFYDGNKFMMPQMPDRIFDMRDYKQGIMAGLASQIDISAAEEYADPDPGKYDGRISGYATCWFPKILVDDANRVHVAWRVGRLPVPPLMGYLEMRTCLGDRWTKTKMVKLDRDINIVKALFDFDLALDGKGDLQGVWDSLYIQLGKTASSVRYTERKRLGRPGRKYRVTGMDKPDPELPGWPVRSAYNTPPTMEKDGKRYLLLFGDTHTHSWTSDGADPADYYYHFARDYARLDFFSLSDHDFLVCGTPGIEAYISFLPRQFTSPDFVCFQAYEFTSQSMGHRVVVFEGSDRPMFPLGVMNSGAKDRSNPPAQLYSFMRRFGLAPDSRVLVTSHNMFQLGNDFKDYDEGLEPLYDVTSIHILAEKTYAKYVEEGKMDPGQQVSRLMKLTNLINPDSKKHTPEHKWYTSWQECLRAGLPIGAYGTSDTHAANGIGWVIAGLWAEEKSRKSIFDAMFAKHSTAIDNVLRTEDQWNVFPSFEREYDIPTQKMDIRFWVDDNFMGTKCRLDGPPLLKAHAGGSIKNDPVARIVFVKDCEDVHVASGGVNPAKAEYKDDNWSGGHTYYARVEFESGSVGFSSPVFTKA